MTGTDIMDIHKSIIIRKNVYINMMAKDYPEDLGKEFEECFESDSDYIRSIKSQGLYSGIIAKETDEFERFLLSLPSQVYSMIKIKEINNEKTK